MNDINPPGAQSVVRTESRVALEPGAEDGFSLSHRSVLTEQLIPARCVPMPRARRRRPTPVETPVVLLPF